jgi:hypothetical protein
LKIFGLLALVMIKIGIISGAANFIVKHTIGIGWGGGFILLIVNVAPVAFINVMSAVIYCSLRAEKENLAARSLEDIFD